MWQISNDMAYYESGDRHLSVQMLQLILGKAKPEYVENKLSKSSGMSQTVHESLNAKIAVSS